MEGFSFLFSFLPLLTWSYRVMRCRKRCEIELNFEIVKSAVGMVILSRRMIILSSSAFVDMFHGWPVEKIEALLVLEKGHVFVDNMGVGDMDVLLTSTKTDKEISRSILFVSKLL